MYCVIAIAIIVFSVLTVTSRKILRSATYLLFVLFATAGIYFQLGYEFLGAVQIAVYAGGIMVLFVFAILLTHRPEEKSAPLSCNRRLLGVIAAIGGAAVCGYALVAQGCEWLATVQPSMQGDTIQAIGHALLSTDKFGYLLPFEALSVLLLACIIGGIVVARKR